MLEERDRTPLTKVYSSKSRKLEQNEEASKSTSINEMIYNSGERKNKPDSNVGN